MGLWAAGARADLAQQQGLQQGALRQLLRLLTKRFGTIPPDVEQGLQAFDVNQLEELVDVALAADSLEQFVNRLTKKYRIQAPSLRQAQGNAFRTALNL